MARYLKYIAILIGGIVVATFFCSNPAGNKNQSNGSPITISGTLAKGAAKISGGADNADSIVAVPCTYGDFIFMDEMRNAIIKSDGTFSIALPQDISYHTGNITLEPEWVLLLIDSRQSSRFDRVLGYVALKDIDQSLIKMPVNKAKGNVDLGTLKQNGNEAQSGSSAADDTAKFSLTISQLKEMARTGKTLKLAKNAYANYHGNDGEKIESFTHGEFDIMSGYDFGSIPLNDVKNKELLPGAYIDTAKISYQVNFISFNLALYNYSQMASGAISFDLYPPTAVQLIVGGLQDPASGLAPITTFISTDPTKNPNQPGSGGIDPKTGVVNSASKITCWLPDDRSDVSGLQRFGLGSYKGIAPSGKWRLKKNSGEIESEFDLGLGSPFDSNGKPVIYLPSVNVAVNTSDNTVSGVTIAWYSWNAESGAYARAANLDLLKNAVGWTEVQLMSDKNGTMGEKIGFGVSSQGAIQPEDMNISLTAVPKNKYVFTAPCMIIVNFRTGGQQFSLSISD